MLTTVYPFLKVGAIQFQTYVLSLLRPIVLSLVIAIAASNLSEAVKENNGTSRNSFNYLPGSCRH